VTRVLSSLPEPTEVLHQPPGLVIGVGQETGEDLHHPAGVCERSRLNMISGLIPQELAELRAVGSPAVVFPATAS
jgi:hypothetical protein